MEAGDLFGGHGAAHGLARKLRLREEPFDFGVRPRDDVHRDELADAPRGRGASIGRRLHRADIAAHEHRDVARADVFLADERRRWRPSPSHRPPRQSRSTRASRSFPALLTPSSRTVAELHSIIPAMRGLAIAVVLMACACAIAGACGRAERDRARCRGGQRHDRSRARRGRRPGAAVRIRSRCPAPRGRFPPISGCSSTPSTTATNCCGPTTTRRRRPRRTGSRANR